MNLYIYDDKEDKTKVISVDKNKLNENEFEFFNDNGIRKVWHSGE